MSPETKLNNTDVMERKKLREIFKVSRYNFGFRRKSLERCLTPRAPRGCRFVLGHDRIWGFQMTARSLRQPRERPELHRHSGTWAQAAVFLISHLPIYFASSYGFRDLSHSFPSPKP